MIKACNTHGGNKRYIQNFAMEVRWKASTWGGGGGSIKNINMFIGN
jgi:hypothetical protein